MKSSTVYGIVGRGKAGWHALGMSGPHEVSSSGGTCEGYASDSPDGTLVYDAEEADYSAFVKLVCGGPIVRPNLMPHEVQRFGAADKATLFGMLPALKGGFATIAAIAATDLSSLDYVGVGVYEALLREVPGVRFGRVQSGKVVWEL